MIDILGVGACVYDTLMLTDKYPAEDTKQSCSDTLISGGGPVSTAIVAAARLGKKCKFIGYLSDDLYSNYLIDDFKKYGIDTEDIIIEKGKTAFHSFLILSKTSGSRTCLFNRGDVTENIQKINFDTIKSAKILHLDGNYLKTATEFAKKAKENGVTVSIDAGGLYQGIETLLPYADILIPSEEFALGLTKENSAENALLSLKEKYNPKIIALTQGNKGGIYFDNGIKRYNSYKVKVVDSNGAGDVFHGAFLTAYLNRLNIGECCDFASKVSAIKCTRVGARQSIPTIDEINNYNF